MNRIADQSLRRIDEPPVQSSMCQPTRAVVDPAAATGPSLPVGFADLRIGLIGPVPPPAGGMANQTRQLGELLQAVGADVTLVPTNPAYWPTWIGHVPVLRAGFRLLPYLLAVWRAAGANTLLHMMANSGWSWHLYAMPALVIGRLRRTPVVINYRGGEAGDFLVRSARQVRWAMRHAACLAVPSGFLAEVFARFGMNARPLPNIVDLSRFHPPESLPNASSHRLVVTRNLEPLYDIGTAIRAFALVRVTYQDASLTISGSGPDAAALAQLCRDLHLESAVHWVGRLDRAQMADLYRNADLSLNPSRADNMPNSVLESLASGVPVASTNVGGVPFLLEHRRTGLLVPPDQPQAMADAVVELLGDSTFYCQLQQAGLAEVQRYTWPRLAPVLAAVYRNVQTGLVSGACRPIVSGNF